MLDKAAAKEALQKFMDPNFAGYIGDATTSAESAQNAVQGWADALTGCVASISPACTQTAKDAARDAFISAAKTFELKNDFTDACDAFASTLGSGMTGYTAFPPPNSFDPLMPPEHPGMSDAAEAADYMAGMLKEWFATGTAKNNATDVVVSWS